MGQVPKSNVPSNFPDCYAAVPPCVCRVPAMPGSIQAQSLPCLHMPMQRRASAWLRGNVDYEWSHQMSENMIINRSFFTAHRKGPHFLLDSDLSPSRRLRIWELIVAQLSISYNFLTKSSQQRVFLKNDFTSMAALPKQSRCLLLLVYDLLILRLTASANFKCGLLHHKTKLEQFYSKLLNYRINMLKQS